MLVALGPLGLQVRFSLRKARRSLVTGGDRPAGGAAGRAAAGGAPHVRARAAQRGDAVGEPQLQPRAAHAVPARPRQGPHQPAAAAAGSARAHRPVVIDSTSGVLSGRGAWRTVL